MPSTSPARGMRDFLPADVRRRLYVMGVVREVYERYGFQPLETPAVENIDTLLGKYGEEGNQLIFKILKRGEHEASGQADLALRYDLTVPLARVIAEHRASLPRFFKRYQIQPVWRADRPARGRFREFYQCDVDAIGTTSPVVEAELCAAACEVMQTLGFEEFELRLNHRAVLAGVLAAAGVPTDRQGEALVALDKLDKIGADGVRREFQQRGIEPGAADRMLRLFANEAREELAANEPQEALPEGPVRSRMPESASHARAFAAHVGNAAEPASMNGSSDGLADLAHGFGAVTGQSVKPTSARRDYLAPTEALDKLSAEVGDHAEAQAGIDTLRRVLELTAGTPAEGRLRVDPSLARGLSYYTGCIMELTVPDLAGSLGGGGRYDNLVGMFGKEQVPAAGFSLGLERILVVMTERDMFPAALVSTPADLLVTIWNTDTVGESLVLAHEVRQYEPPANRDTSAPDSDRRAPLAQVDRQNSRLRVDVYPEAHRLGKQFKYAADLGVPFVAVVGDDERASGTVTIKNLLSGEQTRVPRADVAPYIHAQMTPAGSQPSDTKPSAPADNDNV